MPTQKHLQVWTVQDERTDDWIKNVIGKDGLTSRKREMKMYAEMDAEQSLHTKVKSTTTFEVVSVLLADGGKRD